MLNALNLEQTYYGGSTLRQPDDFRHSKREEDILMIATSHDIESARLSMLEARKVLDDYEKLKGFASSCDHMRLTQAFAKATRTYLQLSASQR